MTGDIILSDGTTITPDDLQKIAAAVEDLIASTAKDPGQYEEVDSLVGISSLPTFQQSGNTFKTVRTTIKALQGVDGKTPQFEIGTVSEGDSPSVTLTPGGSDGSGNPIYNINLVLAKGETGDPGTDGKTPKFEVGEIATLEPGQPATVQISFKENDVDGSPIYEISMSLPKGSKGDSGNDGKTPVLESVNVTSGEIPSGSFTKNGVDEDGNPKYILNLTTPKGKDGQPAVFEQGATTTLDPSEEARVEVVENGETPEGNPKYILNFFIPRGQTGPAGAGTGNVLVDVTGLVSGKKYLFEPDSDNSSSGTFVEYIEPRIPTETSDLTNNSGFITKAVNDLINYYLKSETYTKEEVQSLISALNSVSLKKVDSLPESGDSNVIYLVPKSGSGNDIYDEYIYIDGKPEHIGSTQVDLSNYVQEAPLDGKTYGRKNEAWEEVVSGESVVIPSTLVTLCMQNHADFSVITSEQILQAIGGESAFNFIAEGIASKRLVLVKYEEVLFYASAEICVIQDGGDINFAVSVDLDLRLLDTSIIYHLNLILSKTGGTYTMSGSIGPYPVLSAGGDGTKVLMDDGFYRTLPNATELTSGYMSAEDKKRLDNTLVFKNVTTATTLTGLSIANYSIKVTLSAASALSFASTPYEGWECMIDIKNSSSSDITQALPNATGWQCEDTSMTIAAGKIASISVRYVHGTYVVLSKGN